MASVQVMNHNDFPLKGRWNGKDYAFPPGRPVELPEEAANHIFGFGADNRTGAYNRLGLLRTGNTMAQAQAVIDRVQFTTGRMVFEEPHPVAPPPEPRPGPDKNEEPEDEDEDKESGKASAQQLAPGGDTEVGAPASAIPVAKKLTRMERNLARIEANERKRHEG